MASPLGTPKSAISASLAPFGITILEIVRPHYYCGRCGGTFFGRLHRRCREQSAGSFQGALDELPAISRDNHREC
jgi:hypothetical protein